jgi:NAD(P)-dependent dehydrogenase (short-subunit alcohol dehydrogenase family)
MDDTFSNRTALVTGGTRGIGKAIAESLLAAGARVAICGRSRESLDQTSRELGARYGESLFGKAADVADPQQVADLFAAVDERFGGLDILVNNAGIGIFAPAADLTVEQWRRVIDTNLSGAFYCSREALARFRRRDGGYIINISSLAGKNPFAGGAVYNASKFALNGFSEALMLDHRYDDVRVTYIMPGSVDTGFSAAAARAGWKIQPEDIAAIVLLLLRMPPRTLVSRIEVRPSKPKK